MDQPIDIKGFKPGIIHLPSYLLQDEELRMLIARQREVFAETGEDLRGTDAINDMMAELRKRGTR